MSLEAQAALRATVNDYREESGLPDYDINTELIRVYWPQLDGEESNDVQ